MVELLQGFSFASDDVLDTELEGNVNIQIWFKHFKVKNSFRGKSSCWIFRNKTTLLKDNKKYKTHIM